MFGKVTFGLRAFFVGLIVGMLLAPRAGRETRQALRDGYARLMDAISEILALPEEPIALPDRGTPAGTSATQSR